MAVSYKKLWHILIDRNMKKKDLEELAGINHYTMNKVSRDENVMLTHRKRLSLGIFMRQCSESCLFRKLTS